LEAAKLGHGGDRRIAEFLGLDVHTVAKGRKELLEDSVDCNGVRNGGSGRKRVEKNTGNDELSNWNYTITPTQIPKVAFLSLLVETQQEPLETSYNYLNSCV